MTRGSKRLFGLRAKVVVESPAKFREWVGGLPEKIPPDWLATIRQDTETNPVEEIGAGGA